MRSDLSAADLVDYLVNDSRRSVLDRALAVCGPGVVSLDELVAAGATSVRVADLVVRLTVGRVPRVTVPALRLVHNADVTGAEHAAPARTLLAAVA